MLKKLIKKSKFLVGLYRKFKYRKKLSRKFKFINRTKNKEKLCYVIAGYKEFLWDIIFERIKTFIPEDIEVCILSSGLYNEKLNKIAEENDWSYLWTKINNVGLSQNILINQFKDAKYIFKLDEDIFVTKDYFTNLLNCFKTVKNGESLFVPGIVAPIIPINGFGHIEVLRKYNLEKTYAEKFEKCKVQAGPHRMIENNPEVAKFMWGYGDYVPHIDKMAEDFASSEFDYLACPIRFSIGAILFERELWERMGYFEVTSKKRVDLGVDEAQICSYCICESMPIIVSKNCLVGHLSFGKQNNAMKEYFLENTDKFKIK